jgi:hypothetical protein
LSCDYIDQLEPENQDVVIWRFMNMKKFADLMATGELFFSSSCRYSPRFEERRFSEQR